MIVRIKSMSFASLFLFLAPAFFLPAQKNDCEKAIAAMDEIIANFESWEGNFSHSASFENEGYAVIETGKLFTEKGGKMRWEYDEPEGKLAISDGKVAWLYLPDEKRAYKGKLTSSPKRLPLPARLFLGKIRPSSEFFCVEAKTEKEILTMALGFKERRVDFRRLKVSLDLKSRFLSEISYMDELDNKILFRFSNGIAGKKHDPSLFSFIPPKGTKISDDFESNFNF